MLVIMLWIVLLAEKEHKCEPHVLDYLGVERFRDFHKKCSQNTIFCNGGLLRVGSFLNGTRSVMFS